MSESNLNLSLARKLTSPQVSQRVTRNLSRARTEKERTFIFKAAAEQKFGGSSKSQSNVPVQKIQHFVNAMIVSGRCHEGERDAGHDGEYLCGGDGLGAIAIIGVFAVASARDNKRSDGEIISSDQN